MATLMYEYTSRGSNLAIFIFAFISNGGHLLKQIICSSGSKFFPLRVTPILEGLHLPRKHIGTHKNCSPLKSGLKP